MKQNLTEMVFILDKSGSMSGLEKSTISGYNELLEKQKSEQGDGIISTVLFDHTYKLLHDRVDIDHVNNLTNSTYQVGGTTALLDAVGRTIDEIGKKLSSSDEADRPEKVIFVIITDGMENASQDYTYKMVQDRIIHQKEKYQWEFLFLGANIDAESEAHRFGIDRSNAVNYHADDAGTNLNYEVLSDAISEFRMNKNVSKNWKKKIDQDYERRVKRYETK